MTLPTVISHISALKTYVGKPLGTTDWHTVTQEQIDAFARATGDEQWLHVDVERAERESPFGGTIAHGYLTISLAPVLLPQLIQVENAARTVNFGIEKMRLPAPVPAGGRIRLSAEIKHVRDITGGGARVTIALSFAVEGGRKPCCTADVIYVYFP